MRRFAGLALGLIVLAIPLMLPGVSTAQTVVTPAPVAVSPVVVAARVPQRCYRTCHRHGRYRGYRAYRGYGRRHHHHHHHHARHWRR